MREQHLETWVHTILRKGRQIFAAADIVDATNVPLYTDVACTAGNQIAVGDSIDGTFYLCDEESGDDCISMQVNTTSAGVAFTAYDTGNICGAVQGVPAIQGLAGDVSGTAKDHRLGGVGVSR